MHIFVGGFRSRREPGVDIIGAEAYGTPAGPYFDMCRRRLEQRRRQAGLYTCKLLTGTAYAVSTDFGHSFTHLATGGNQNICKPPTGNSAAEGEARSTWPKWLLR